MKMAPEVPYKDLLFMNSRNDTQRKVPDILQTTVRCQRGGGTTQRVTAQTISPKIASEIVQNTGLWVRRS